MQALRAAREMAEQAQPSDLESLYALLRSPDVIAADAALRPITRLAGVQALPTLSNVLRQREALQLGTARLVYAMAQLLRKNQQQSVWVLLGMMRDDDYLIRRDAAWAWRFLKPRYSASSLVWLLNNDAHPVVRATAAQALRNFHGESIVAALALALADESADVRVSVAMALCRNTTRSAIPALQLALDDENAQVRELAQVALKRAMQPRWRNLFRNWRMIIAE